MERQLEQIIKLYQDNEYDKAYHKAKLLLELATEKNDAHHQAFANFYMGISNFGLRKFSNVEEFLDKAIRY